MSLEHVLETAGERAIGVVDLAERAREGRVDVVPRIIACPHDKIDIFAPVALDIVEGVVDES
jgi:hypothetical protein